MEYPPFKGGVSNYYENLVKYYPDRENIYVLNNNNKELDNLRAFFSWRKAFFKVYREIKKNNIKRIIVGHVLPLGTVAYVLSYILPFKYIVIFHGLDFSLAKKSPRKRFLLKKILDRSYKIVAANSYVADEIVNFSSENKEKINVVNPGICLDNYNEEEYDIKALKNKYGVSSNLVLFSLGRLTKRKGFDATIEAIDRLSDADLENIIYFIAGKGEDEQYLKSIVSDRLRGKVVFLGEIKEEEKWEFLSLCDIFIMPARNINGDYEGFGIVYLEANMALRPVIAGLSGGVSDAVVDGENGLLVNPDNIEEIKDAILRLMNDNELRSGLGKKGRERAVSEFSWPKLIQDMYKIIQ